MHVGTVELHNFRSYEYLFLKLTPGINVLVGPNGAGKTNVVEALGYVSMLNSHRVSTDLPLVRIGPSNSDVVDTGLVDTAVANAVVRVEVIRNGRSAVTEIEITPGRANRMQIQGSPVKPREVLGNLRAVVFAPEDLILVKGDPVDRRRFIDDLLIQRAPRYFEVRADYERIVRQRTALLKSLAGARRGATVSAEAQSTLAVWNGHLAATGASLLFGRLSLLDEVGSLFAIAYQQVAEVKSANIGYLARSLGPDVTDQDLPRDRACLESILLDQLELRRNDEIDRGVTLVGPHRDDLTMVINNLPAKGYASHGECWSLALALRLGSFELMRKFDDGAGDPVLILDDVFAELDKNRREALAEVAASSEQVIVTAAVAQDVPSGLVGQRFTVRPGQVTLD